MADIKEINDLFEKQCQRKDEIDKQITLDYLNSILYVKDIKNNEKILNDLSLQIKNMYTKIKQMARKCEVQSSTALIGRAGVLSGYASSISDIPKMINDILNKIQQKSNIIFDNKIQEYKQNKEKINRYIDDYNEKLTRYNDANNKKTDYAAKEHYTDSDEDRKEYKRLKNIYENRRVQYLSECENNVNEITTLNDFNNDLVDEFIKIVN